MYYVEFPRRSHPAQSGVDRFGPPTLERSGSAHRVGRCPTSSLRFLSPGNGGTEGGVKTIEEDRDEGWSLLLWEKAMPMSALKARFQIAECSSLYQQRRTG